jgi:hypothetical protein
VSCLFIFASGNLAERDMVVLWKWSEAVSMVVCLSFCILPSGKKKRVTICLDDCLPVKACHNQIMVDIPLSVLYCALICGSVFPSLCKPTSALI